MASLPRRIYRHARALSERRRDRSLRPRVRFDADAPAMLLSPHLDDAVLDCWGLLTNGRPLNVVNAFAGAPPAGRLAPWDEITGARDSATRVHERREEDARALELAGRGATCLELLDAQYRADAPDLRALDAALAAAVPDACRVYAPAGIGAHADHVLARRYARALRAAGMPVTLYAELPYCVLHGWPHWVDGRAEDPYRNVDAHWRSFLRDVAELPGDLRAAARVVRLSDEQAAGKLEAMRCYRSQLPALEYGARGLLADPEVHRYEVTFALTPAGSPRAR